MKKAAPPGRRSSAARVKKFTADTEELIPIEDLQALAHPAAEGHAALAPPEEQTQTPPAVEEAETDVETPAVVETAAGCEQDGQADNLTEMSNGTRAPFVPYGQETADLELDRIAASYEAESATESDADDADAEEDAVAKAQALALQREAEQLAQQTKAEQEYVVV